MIFQSLIEDQRLYKLLQIAERDVDIELEDFNPKQCSASIKLCAARTKSNHWEPEVIDDPLWLEDQQSFVRVRDHIIEDIYQPILLS